MKLFRIIGYLFIGFLAFLLLPMTVMALWANRAGFDFDGIELFGLLFVGAILSVLRIGLLFGAPL